MKFRVLFLLAALAGCGDATSSPMGNVELSFTVGEPVRLNFTGDLTGTVLGQLYLTEDLAFVGDSVVSVPDATQAIIGMVIEGADFTEMDTLPNTVVTDPLPEGTYTFLGALDVDDNGNDVGDPVTFSMQGSFTVSAGETATHEVMFNGIQPF